MKFKPTSIIKIIIVKLLVIFTTNSYAAISGLVAFGDSLSDTGNVSALLDAYVISSRILPIPNPKAYYAGRFSNGPVWIERLAYNLQLPLDNHAIGDAESYRDTLKIPVVAPTGLASSLVHQVDSYLASYGGRISNTNLYLLWIGGNDYLHSYETHPEFVVSAIIESANKLYAAGATNILILNLPNLANSPVVRENGTDWNARQLQSIISTHNSLLRDNIAALQQQVRSSAQIRLFDVESKFDDFLRNPAQYGYSNVTARCYEGGYILRGLTPIHNGIINTIENEMHLSRKIPYRDYTCANPDGYLFWDSVHPTTYTHNLLANAVAEFIQFEL